MLLDQILSMTLTKMGRISLPSRFIMLFVAPTVFRRTPLHWATVCENAEAIKILLEFRGMIKTQMIRLYIYPLLCYGCLADPEVRDCKNQTPLDYAREKKLHYCSLLLQSRVEPLHTPDTRYGQIMLC